MPPLYTFKCEDCNQLTEAISKVDQTFIYCSQCQPTQIGAPPPKAHKTMSTFAGYKINGNNSASTTPKKFRGQRR